MALLTRRRLLALAGLGGAGLLGGGLVLPWWLRRPPPGELDEELTAFVDSLFEGIDRSRVWDVHCHLFGVGDGGTGCWVNPDMLSPLHPVEHVRWLAFTAAAGIENDQPDRDGQYLQRLLALHRAANPAGRLVLLAFDQVVDEQGVEHPELSSYFTPNAYVLDVARREADVEAGVSIHPYREDAVERLERAADAGARLVKWIPAAMGIDPASPRCDAFYRALATRGLPLLTHAGREAAVSADTQALGNPLRLRRPLEAGVRVVVAHAASFGEDEDLDAPAGRRETRPSHELLLRMMGEEEHERHLFADISALTQVNRCGAPLRALLTAHELHHRLVDGSDYPLPAIDLLFSTWQLVRLGYLTEEQRRLANRLFEVNPLLFDFALKRCVSVREEGREHRFPPTVFESAWLFA